MFYYAETNEDIMNLLDGLSFEPSFASTGPTNAYKL